MNHNITAFKYCFPRKEMKENSSAEEWQGYYTNQSCTHARLLLCEDGRRKSVRMGQIRASTQQTVVCTDMSTLSTGKSTQNMQKQLMKLIKK